jgi:hypothetical protein
MHEHIPELHGTTPTASHSANISLCRYLPERRWDQLPARNLGFVGRGDLLTQMENRCFDGAPGSSDGLVSLALTNALTGSGGVGKSQSANEFAHRNLKVREKKEKKLRRKLFFFTLNSFCSAVFFLFFLGLFQRYSGFCRWVAAENVVDATAQLAELAKIACVPTDNKPVRRWVSEMYHALDEGIFLDQVRTNCVAFFSLF